MRPSAKIESSVPRIPPWWGASARGRPHRFDVTALSVQRTKSNGTNRAECLALTSLVQSILLIDDDADLRMRLRDFLTEEGFVVHAARTGRHGFHILEKIDVPDLILLDYKMPV